MPKGQPFQLQAPGGQNGKDLLRIKTVPLPLDGLCRVSEPDHAPDRAITGDSADHLWPNVVVLENELPGVSRRKSPAQILI